MQVESALDSHMEYCRKKYREAYNLQRWDSEDEEDATKKAKYEEKATAERKRKAVNSRKKTVSLFSFECGIVLTCT